MKPSNPFNPNLDLTFERVVEAPRELIWRAWTEPEHLMPWFCPKPWQTVECEMELCPGGKFRTVMQSPEGIQFPNDGCYLQLIKNQKLTWTNALLPGFRPAILDTSCGDAQAQFFFTATIELAVHGSGTRYSATVIHADAAGCQKHAEMGFEAGWGAALEQLVAYVKTL